MKLGSHFGTRFVQDMIVSIPYKNVGAILEIIGQIYMNLGFAEFLRGLLKKN